MNTEQLSRLILASAAGFLAGWAASPQGQATEGLARIEHVVVIYAENRSFDHLYGLFPGADGIASATPEQKTQLDHDGKPLPHLPPVYDGGKPSPKFPQGLPNGPFRIDAPPVNQRMDEVLPNPIHAYYHSREQINGGRNNMFVAMSTAGAWVMGYFDGSKMKLWKWAQEYTLADHFFHAAFGGSFLNHQWLVCACTPVSANAVSDGSTKDLHTILGANGLPTKDGQLTTKTTGDYAVNTIFPSSKPTIPAAQLPLLHNMTIGDELSTAGISWAWYSGGWNNAVAGNADPLFQYHHQPFNYYANFAPGTAGRAHLKDETDFIAAAQAGTLPAVSFVKPIGADNEHPGYTDVLRGEKHLLDLINDVRSGPNWKDTAIVITYDEHGGFWDHAAPPTDGHHSDIWGPGSRVPSIVISPLAKKHFVDHTLYDTTSILATIERRWDLQPLGSRDAMANDLRRAFTMGVGNSD